MLQHTTFATDTADVFIGAALADEPAWQETADWPEAFAWRVMALAKGDHDIEFLTDVGRDLVVDFGSRAPAEVAREWWAEAY